MGEAPPVDPTNARSSHVATGDPVKLGVPERRGASEGAPPPITAAGGAPAGPAKLSLWAPPREAFAGTETLTPPPPGTATSEDPTALPPRAPQAASSTPLLPASDEPSVVGAVHARPKEGARSPGTRESPASPLFTAPAPDALRARAAAAAASDAPLEALRAPAPPSLGDGAGPEARASGMVPPPPSSFDWPPASRALLRDPGADASVASDNDGHPATEDVRPAANETGAVRRVQVTSDCACNRCLSYCRCGNANTASDCIACCGGGGGGGSSSCSATCPAGYYLGSCSTCYSVSI